MRNLLTWLMIAGILLTTAGRLFPHVALHDGACVAQNGCHEIQRHSCEGDLKCDLPAGTCASPECSAQGTIDSKETGHHHHQHFHVCCGTVPVMAEHAAVVTSEPLLVSRSLVSRERHIEPDSPVFELDKPPLI